jgi:hypothetical protein
VRTERSRLRNARAGIEELGAGCLDFGVIAIGHTWRGTCFLSSGAGSR